jgi:hypothetical protein
MMLPSRAAGLSFITPLAYDYRMAFAAIRSYYAVADEIILGLDRDRVSWNGKPFALDGGELREGLRSLDTEGKIRLVEGDFHAQGSATANDTHERNALSMECRPGNWLVQIDSDELLQNPAQFRDWLLRRSWHWLVLGRWTVVFKRFGDDYLVVDKHDAWISVASRLRGAFTGCRDTKELKRRSPLHLLHFSWGRSEEELLQKLQSWTHARDFDTAKFFELWKSVDLENYGGLRDFHPLDGPDWPSLRLIRKGDPDWVAPPS